MICMDNRIPLSLSLKILECGLIMLIIIGLVFRLEFTVDAYHLMIVWGVIAILPSIIFIVLEKRDV